MSRRFGAQAIGFKGEHMGNFPMGNFQNGLPCTRLTLKIFRCKIGLNNA